MADDESYGIMPYSEISELKKQVKKLQEKSSVGADELLSSVKNLTNNMDSMLHLFKTAADEMKIEEEEEKALSHQIKPLMDKIGEIIEQNKIIAEGMVAISDLVKEKFSEKMQEKVVAPKEEEPMVPENPPHEEQKFPKMPPPQPAPFQRPPPLGRNMPPPPGMYPPRGPAIQDSSISIPPPPEPMLAEEPVKKRGFFSRK